MVTGRGRRFASLALGGLLACAAATGVLNLRVDNAPERFFARQDEGLERQARLEALFGRSRQLRLVVLGDELWSPPGLTALAAVEEAVSSHPHVLRTSGLWSRHRWLEPEWPPADLEAFRRLVLADPLDRAAGFIGRSGRAASVLVELAPGASSNEVTEIEAQARQTLPRSLDLETAGLPVLERSMNHSLRRLVVVQLPLLLAATAILLWLELRSLAAVLAPIAFVTALEITTLGALGHAGATIDMVSSILAPLLFVISLATAIHLLTGVRHEQRRGLGAADAVAAMLARKRRAVVCTVLTTAAAFGTFAVNPVPPLRSLGLWLAAGLACLLIASLGFYPTMLTELTSRNPTSAPGLLERMTQRRAAALATWIQLRRRRILVAFALLGSIAGAGLLHLQAASGLASYFGPAHPARRALLALEAEGLGAGVAHLLIRLPSSTPIDNGLRSPDGLERLADLSAELRAVPDLRGSLGAGDLFAAALADVVVEGEPSSGARWLVLGMMQSDATIAARLDSLLAEEGRTARIILTLPLLPTGALDAVLASAQEVAARAFPEATVEIAGELPLLLATQRHLLTTLGVSLALTLGVIVLSFRVVTGSGRLALLALTPNLWAVLVVFGVMGWLEVGLDSTTVMIAALVAGLAVDDTFHLLAELETAAGASAVERWTEVLSRTTPALVLTSVVLATGFAILMLSDFAPIARLGAFASVGIAAALAGDLVLLPALLAGSSTKRRALGEKRGQQ